MRRAIAPILAGLLSLAAFLPGLAWGLPSRDADPFLFGDRTPWTGGQIVALLGEFDPAGAADVDQTGGGGVVNDTDRERAEIVARYRLYSYQPDEMLTFRALAAAAGNRGDPRFYTYGGLWVYPVGGLIVLGQQLGLIGIGDQAYYLDNPTEFAKFYLVARGYAVAWATVGAAVVCVLVRRVTRSNVLGVAAAVTYALLPVVVVGAHEAKPHLPGAVLATWAVLPAERYVRTGRGLLWAGVLCGLAAGMVVTMAVSFLVLPVAFLLHKRHKPRANSPPVRPQTGDLSGRGYGTLLASVALGVLAFAVTNPYVVVNLLADPSALAGNAANTAGHYTLGWDSFGRAIDLSRNAATLPFIVSGLVPLAVVPMLRRRGALRARTVWWLLAPAATVAWIGFMVTAGGRPADHARFATLPAVALVVANYGGWAVLLRRTPAREVGVAVPLATSLLVAFAAWFYIAAYVEDVHGEPGRYRAAVRFAEEGARLRGRLSLPRDPAPFSVPPFDLWRWRAYHYDADDTPSDAQLIYLREEDVAGTPISWVRKPMVFVVRTDGKPTSRADRPVRGLRLGMRCPTCSTAPATP